jgi:cytochrome c-type biogenesis protein CcsB
MEFLLLIVIILNILSSAAYVAFLFLQKEKFHQIGFFLFGIGFFLLTVSLVIGTVSYGHLPVHNLYETLLFFSWTVSFSFLLFTYKYGIKILGVYATPLVAIILTATSFIPHGPSADGKLFDSLWLVAHIGIIFIGEAALGLACGIGILYIIQENAIKSKKPGFFYKRLPSLELLDSAGYAAIVTGFTMLSIGLATGFIYAKSVWGRFWSWDPKEVWSGITWLIYAILLHERLFVGWKGRKSAIMTIIGFAVIVFTFLGVNLFLKGHHGIFTR